MAFPTGDPDNITGYHAHVYYDAETRETAARLRQRIWQRFDGTMGRFRDRPVGPHPRPMYLFAFEAGLFPEIVPWLMTNRDGLTVLVHPESGDSYNDHAHWPLWLGGKLRLRVAGLRRNRKAL